MNRDLFRPTWQQAAVLALLVAGAMSYAASIRYLAIEDPSVALGCDAGDVGWLCSGRHMALALTKSYAFGLAALGAAVLNLIRPSIVLSGLALVAAGMGLILYNTALAATAIALLVLSLARPVPEPE